MFAINGPSGPTTRCERRIVTPAEKQQLEAMRKQRANEKSESFFNVRSCSTASTTTKQAAVAPNQSLTTTAFASEAVIATDATRHREPSAASRDTQKEPGSSSASSDASQIFKGCRILFNGRTGNISSYYLAKLVQDHGGNVCSALTTTRVTHMVGANLSGAKADKVLKTLGKVKDVSPDWILQSVKHAKRQSEFDYLLYKDAQQQRLR